MKDRIAEIVFVVALLVLILTYSTVVPTPGLLPEGHVLIIEETSARGSLALPVLSALQSTKPRAHVQGAGGTFRQTDVDAPNEEPWHTAMQSHKSLPWLVTSSFSGPITSLDQVMKEIQ